jgi:hypothetical protein
MDHAIFQSSGTVIMGLIIIKGQLLLSKVALLMAVVVYARRFHTKYSTCLV